MWPGGARGARGEGSAGEEQGDVGGTDEADGSCGDTERGSQEAEGR